jgi:hypothetical protein
MIVSNQVECLACGDQPFSRNRHDFRYCKCGAVAVDGGTEYLRRVYADDAQWRDISIELPTEVVNATIDAVKWGKDTGRNDRGIAYAVIRALRDSGVSIEVKAAL